ncbi:hypothetical protein [Xylella fastidiosa]|uniref:Uncharacterized protein n=1 Tax=Xylella fastidiosa subsp. sandyi Ann-1 TaxID=155920 RepID=A0A060HDZ3_XYLFS|nr:hypothetical protein [Xylella fastidiosa]AIC11631.1 hypothetical protein D934_12280 [Xylella fastidiosa subsp. sandyi Ann-1]UIX80957.1 hypothetical protein LZ756_10890 [Xylella fastidiosa subsp. sandyi]
MALVRRERILILAKTYPSPSAKHVETSCVAGINQDGVMRRLYPVPFRMIEQDQQFKKWQWIEVNIEKATSDHRLESHKVDIGSLEAKEKITTKKEWEERRAWIDKILAFSSYETMELARKDDGVSIALLCPKKVLGLEIKDARNKNWTEEEKEKLMRAQMQGNLFSEAQAKHQVKELRKVPFDFYYYYVCDTPDGEQEHKHKIVDWEAGALFWNMYREHGIVAWKDKFRAKLEGDLISKELMFLMGNQHRFQDQWLIISLLYPPKRKPFENKQMQLF